MPPCSPGAQNGCFPLCRVLNHLRSSGPAPTGRLGSRRLSRHAVVQLLCGLSLKQISISPSPHRLTCGSEAFCRRACDNPTAAQRSGGGDGRGGEGLRQLERSTQHLATGDGAHMASPFLSVVRPGDGCHLVNPTYCSHDKAARPTPTF